MTLLVVKQLWRGTENRFAKFTFVFCLFGCINMSLKLVLVLKGFRAIFTFIGQLLMLGIHVPLVIFKTKLQVTDIALSGFEFKMNSIVVNFQSIGTAENLFA